MKMKRHRQPLEVMASMNITNLLDTAFILLITFMIIAPQLSHSIKIEIPEVDNPPQTDVDEQHTILIVIEKRDPLEPEEHIYIDDERVDLDTMLQRILEKRAQDPKLIVAMEGDAKVSLGMYIKVLTKLGEAQIKIFDFSVLPTSPTP